uniref:Uncharacterized protein n=1 Tax=Trichobilharzia regenti TaxID=157069 RepID=A0AA85KGQ2_TRIRE|nr:unnamed protein product [Trichobilharzia regenti]
MNYCWGLFGVALHISSLYRAPGRLHRSFRTIGTLSCRKFLPIYSTNLLKHTGRGRRHFDDKDEDDDSDEEFSDEFDTNSESNDPYYSEDVEFNPNFKQISTCVKSLRFDKIIRVGLVDFD